MTMSTSEADGWICPQCGQTNYYHPTRCRYCPYGRRMLDKSSTGGVITTERNQFHSHEGERDVDHQRRIIYVCVSVFALTTWIYLIWEYHKWDAQWGSISVFVPASILALFVGWWISRGSWFIEKDGPTRRRFMIVPMVGFILCAASGIYFTEPVERGGSVTRSGSTVSREATISSGDRRSSEYAYNYGRSRAGSTYLWASLFDLGSGAGDFVDGAGDLDEGCLLLLLVLLVIMLIIGSVVVPHFWILSTFLLVVVMAMVTFREWRLVEHNH